MPFEITILAKDKNENEKNYNGDVALSSSVHIEPTSVKFSNGIWQGEVTLLEGCSNLFLFASAEGIQGKSDLFSTPPTPGQLFGSVTDNRHNILVGAMVYLSETEFGPPVYSTETNIVGDFSFLDDVVFCAVFVWIVDGPRNHPTNVCFEVAGLNI